MACCLICVKGTAVPGSKLNAFYTNPDPFRIGTMDACYKNCPWCVFGYICMCCAQFMIRKKALDGNLENYHCCQGYAPLCCSSPGGCGERKCPCLCLCLESFACVCFAMSSNRMYLMNKFKVQPDPWDNRIIRSKNCLHLTVSWICLIGDTCFEAFGALIVVVDLIAELVYVSAAGCVAGQLITEMLYRGSNAPSAATIIGR